ncbi:MAG: lipopolysaccharide transport periplasmic protein LptA [Desulfofustis sp.]|nr:lipopolysaccharide transport periplasmic protein LptA [Desulfofustis sp.]
MHRYRITSSFLVITFFYLLCVGLSPASAVDNPIYVEADQMSSTAESNTVLFTGNVDAKQGDLRIRSDKMTVYYDDPETPEEKNVPDTTQRIEKLVCVGNVEITREDWLGTSENMTYLADSRQVILTGNAKAWQGQNMVTGQKIIYYMDEGRSEVVGGTAVTAGGGERKADDKGRVKMTIRQQ